MTAMYHWIFVPLTLELSFLIAFFESIYVKTGNEEWKKVTKFWMILFGINFAIGVATGIILEFEFGTNWSNYSWMVAIGSNLSALWILVANGWMQFPCGGRVFDQFLKYKNINKTNFYVY